MQRAWAFIARVGVLSGVAACGGAVAVDDSNRPPDDAPVPSESVTSPPAARSPETERVNWKDADFQMTAPVCATRYPDLTTRISNFEARRTSPTITVRSDVTREIGWLLPLPEAERYERDVAACDGDPTVRGAAANALLVFGYPLRPSDLPFGLGEPGGQYPKSVAGARDALAQGGATAGWAAHYLAVYGEANDVPRIETLSSDPNVFARFAAAHALLSLGETQRGTALLDGIARLPDDPEVLFYVEVSLILFHKMRDAAALTDLVAFLGTLESSTEPNHVTHFRSVLRILSALTGEWHDGANAWRSWLEATGRPVLSTRRS